MASEFNNFLIGLFQRRCSNTQDKTQGTSHTSTRGVRNAILLSFLITVSCIYEYQSCRLKSELIEKGNGSPHLLQAAIHQSNDITKKRFHKPVVREDSHMGLVRKAKANLNSRQMWAARELYKWRDRVSVILERIEVIV